MITVSVLLNVSMVGGHDALVRVAKSQGMNLEKLDTGCAVVFINRKREKMKVYSYNGVLSYMRSPEGRPFDLMAIDEFPKAFDANGRMDYPAALKLRIEKALQKQKTSTTIRRIT